jgi:Fibronectin type III domain
VHAKRLIKASALALLSVGFPASSYAADLTLAWDPPTDGLTTGYVLSFGGAPSTYAQQVDVGFATSYTISGLNDGSTYYFVVRAYDASGNLSALSAEVSATITPSVPPAVTSVALSSNVPSPVVLGTTVNWLSTASGGVAPYQFQWGLYNAGTWTQWPWSSASTWSWTPSTAGSDYQISVAVRSSGSTSTTGELSQSVPFAVTQPTVSAVGLVSSVPSPQVVGTTVAWSATASGGIPPYQYKWWVYDGTTWNAMTGWGTGATWSWTPTVANNNYTVRVWARSAGDVVDAGEASNSIAYAIKSPTKTRLCQGPKCK